MADANHRVTRDKLDAFPIPVGSSLVLYDRRTRKALFFTKNQTSYTLKNTYNKRRRQIQVRRTDYLLTMDFDGSIFPGDTANVFTRA